MVGRFDVFILPEPLRSARRMGICFPPEGESPLAPTRLFLERDRFENRGMRQFKHCSDLRAFEKRAAL